MLIDELRAQLRAAMKARKLVEKEILRVAIGEIETAASRSNKELSDAEAQGILRKLVKSNEETLQVQSDAEQKAILEQEIAVLTALLPQTLSVDQIVTALSEVGEAIRGAKADGPAVGIAMKHLKSSGALVDGKDVSSAVRQMRG
jgi:uncharacterized protein YqeY